jgi:hypothetical protein
MRAWKTWAMRRRHAEVLEHQPDIRLAMTRTAPEDQNVVQPDQQKAADSQKE